VEDLAWLGLSWPAPVRQQSEHMPAYAAALACLGALTYPCFCSRKDIAEAAAAPQGPAAPLYPGTCRRLSPAERQDRLTQPYVIRLDMARALASLAKPLHFFEHGQGPDGQSGLIAADPAAHGDIVLARKDTPASYHLCVVCDDALQGVSLVTRGGDLFAATSVHRLLQTLLDLPQPDYWHHRLIRHESGRRLAKRDADKTLHDLRNEGARPADIRMMVGL
jgi:glutamyl-Q tRNA(Asp) synthetase